MRDNFKNKDLIMDENLKKDIFNEGRESFPWWWIISENFLFLLNWGLGFFLLLPFRYKGIPVVSIIYIVDLLWVQILLKKHNCSNCYYYGKNCHLGWGRISKILFKENSGSTKTGMIYAFSYILQLPVILAGTIAAGVVYSFERINMILLAVFIIINVVQGAVLRKKGCEVCKARYICKGSAAGRMLPVC